MLNFQFILLFELQSRIPKLATRMTLAPVFEITSNKQLLRKKDSIAYYLLTKNWNIRHAFPLLCLFLCEEILNTSLCSLLIS